MLRYVFNVDCLWIEEEKNIVRFSVQRNEIVYCDLEPCEMPYSTPTTKVGGWKVTAYFPERTVVGYHPDFLGFPVTISNEELLFDGRFNMANNAK